VDRADEPVAVLTARHDRELSADEGTSLPSTVPWYAVDAIPQAVSPLTVIRHGLRFPVICFSKSMSAGEVALFVLLSSLERPDSTNMASGAIIAIAAFGSAFFIAA
jgi:hypothetical protein